MQRERYIYLKLVKELEEAHEALDTVDKRVHQLLEHYDQQRAKKIIKDVKKELKL